MEVNQGPKPLTNSQYSIQFRGAGRLLQASGVRSLITKTNILHRLMELEKKILRNPIPSKSGCAARGFRVGETHVFCRSYLGAAALHGLCGKLGTKSTHSPACPP